MSGHGICLTCGYFEHDVDDDSVATVWPAVDWSDWCGEWRSE